MLETLNTNIFWGNSGVLDKKVFVDLGENPMSCIGDLCWISEYGRAGKLEVKFDEGQMCGNLPLVTIQSYIDDMTFCETR